MWCAMVNAMQCYAARRVVTGCGVMRRGVVERRLVHVCDVCVCARNACMYRIAVRRGVCNARAYVRKFLCVYFNMGALIY